MFEWVSVRDGLPLNARRVLVNHKLCGRIVASLVGTYNSEGVFKPIRWGVVNEIDFELDDVTHWMDLPKSPKGG